MIRPEALELRRIAMPLVVPFRTSFGEESERDVLLVRLTGTDAATGEPVEGWGECVAMAAPLYSYEFVDAAEQAIAHHLWPRLVAPGPLVAADVAHRLEPVKGWAMAKAALEMAVLDAELRLSGTNLHGHFAESSDEPLADSVASGVSVGIFDDLDTLLAQVQGYVDEGYARIKIKIEPGWDLEPTRLVRELIGPEMGLQVDANTAYSRADIEHLRRLDAYDLLLIEQPLPDDDLLGHAALAAAIDTPVCLDETVTSLQTAADAIELGAAEVVNIKAGRVGGYLAARRIHDLCRSRGVPVWCGGMLETGIGRAANAALAALPGFTLPGDISAASRFYARDIVRQPITVDGGRVAVPTAAGLGFDLDRAYLDEVTTATTALVA